MTKQSKQIGIIGGQGKMGKWFTAFLQANGHEVQVSDLGTTLTNEQLVKTSDVVIFSVPIQATPKLVTSLAHLSRPEQLWLDLTSIKQPTVRALLKTEAEVVSLHPMFSPSVESITGQRVAVCPMRVNVWKGWMEKLLTRQGAVLKITTPAVHDQMMALVQGLTHFSAITFAYTLQMLQADVPESLDYTSPVYKIHFDMMARILAQDPGLYADIQLLNPAVDAILETSIKASSRLYHVVKDRDHTAFKHYFQTAAKFLGELKEEAFDESNQLIKAWSNLPKIKSKRKLKFQ